MKNRAEYAAILGILEIGQPAVVHIVEAGVRLVTTLPVIRILQGRGLFETANTIYRPIWPMC